MKQSLMNAWGMMKKWSHQRVNYQIVEVSGQQAFWLDPQHVYYIKSPQILKWQDTSSMRSEDTGLVLASGAVGGEKPFIIVEERR